jgi:AcrR family transcriptional regulator
VNNRSVRDSKTRILDAAFHVFSERGYEGTSMRMIAARADISVGGLYLYFAHKEALYSTLMEKVLEDVLREMEETAQKAPDPVMAISALIRMRLSSAKKNKELINSNTKDRRLTLDSDRKKRFFEKQRALIESIVEEGVKSGVFADCDPKEAAKVIVGLLRGFVFSLVVDVENLFSPEECVRLILNGLLTRLS